MIRSNLQPELAAVLSRRLPESYRGLWLFGSGAGFVEAEDAPILADINLLVLFQRVGMQEFQTLRSTLSATSSLRRLARDLADLVSGKASAQDLTLRGETLFEGLDVLALTPGELQGLPRIFPHEWNRIQGRAVCLDGSPSRLAPRRAAQDWVRQSEYELAGALFRLRRLLAQDAPNHPEVLTAMVEGQGLLASILPALLGFGMGASPPRELLLERWRGWGLSRVEIEAFRELQLVREGLRRPARGEIRAIVEGFHSALTKTYARALSRPPRRGKKAYPRRRSRSRKRR